MEIRARYTLIGAFTLAILAAGFLFVYWLNAAGGIGPRATYRVSYDGPVAGLLKGSAVLFNGVRVGEVTAMALDPARPAEVSVEISVALSTPVRADTRVGIDFQGLTGAPVVTLEGGSPALPLLASAAQREPVRLKAEKNAGVSMTQAARDALRHVDELVTGNAATIKNVVNNVDKFAGALARNSDRIDNVVAGIERFTGQTKAQARIFDLPVAKSFTGIKRIPAAQLLIADPSALTLLDNEQIVVQRAGPVDSPPPNIRWPDTLPKVVQTRLVQSFENAGYLGALAKVPDSTRGDYQLLLDVRSFQIMFDPAASTSVEIGAKIVKGDGQITATRVFKAASQPATDDIAQLVKVLGGDFLKLEGEIVAWVLGAIL